MPSSKNAVFKASPGGPVILDYQPRTLGGQVSPSASEFLIQQQTSGSGFKISPLVAERVGISDIQRKQLEARVEEETLNRIKEIQEKAYSEGFELGRKEGVEQALGEHRQELTDGLSKLGEVLKSLEDLRQQVFVQNENSLVQLTYQIAKKIAMHELGERPEWITDILSQVIEGAQAEEQITVFLGSEDYEFVVSMEEKLGKKLDFLKKVKLEVRPGVSSGGCLVDTNYGMIDATVEQRVEKVWETLKSRLSKVKLSGPGDAA